MPLQQYLVKSMILDNLPNLANIFLISDQFCTFVVNNQSSFEAFLLQVFVTVISHSVDLLFSEIISGFWNHGCRQ
jgi:hypothetical protein